MTSNFWGLLHNWRQQSKTFINGWLFVLGLKECLVECATVCVKSVVILCCTQHCTLGATSKFSSHIKRQQQRFRRFFVLFPTFCIYYASRYKNKKSVAGKEKSYLFPPLIIVIKVFIYKSCDELSTVQPTIQCVF